MSSTSTGIVGRAAEPAPPDCFAGPLFIVGMGRSGTKLLRDLLRGHPRLGIPPVETGFLPRWVAEWESYGDLSDRERFASFYRRNLRAPYFLYVARHPRSVIPEDEWYRACRSFEPADVFEALIRRDAEAPVDSGIIWGDKSPDYVRHVDLLARLYPTARFVHIVRDVRDYCLSLRKRNGKNMLRAAQQWTDGVVEARRDGEALGPARYLEVRYEDLLVDPERELRRCCALLGIEFDPTLLELKFFSEHSGDARGARGVVATNAGKFASALSPEQTRKLEAVAGPALRAFGYPVAYEGPPRRLSPSRMATYRVVDSLNYLRIAAARPGFARTAQIELGRLLRG